MHKTCHSPCAISFTAIECLCNNIVRSFVFDVVLVLTFWRCLFCRFCLFVCLWGFVFFVSLGFVCFILFCFLLCVFVFLVV